MWEKGVLEADKRIYAKGYLSALQLDLVRVTDLSKDLYGTKGEVEKLTKAYLSLNTGDELVKYPPDAVRYCHVGDQVTLAMEPTTEECSEVDESKDARQKFVAKLNEKLKPCYTHIYETPGGPQQEQAVVSPKTMILFIDHSFIATIEKYPSTIGKERLMIQSQRLLFPNNEHWANQVRELEVKCSSWRKSRGDGNCYYRAVSISYLEEMLRRKKFPQLHALYMKLFNQEDYIIPMGFEDHHYYFLLKIGQFLNAHQNSERIVKDFQELELEYAFDNAMIGVFRSMAADWLEKNKGHDEIFPFIMDSGVEPILREIRTDEKEGEGLAFVAMANTLQATIHHIIADQNTHKTHTETFRPFTGESDVEFSLLLRPGHYDLIYYKESDEIDHYDTCLQGFH
jgi:ubiquitin thioesterase protein OTUB1